MLREADRSSVAEVAKKHKVIESWRQHDNTVRPHMSPNYLTPHKFKSQHPPRAINPAILQQ